MRKKALNVILFLAVVIAAVGMTLYVGRGAASILVYNFCFLGIMVIAYAVGMFGGMFRMNDLSRAFRDAADELKDFSVTRQDRYKQAFFPERHFSSPLSG